MTRSQEIARAEYSRLHHTGAPVSTRSLSKAIAARLARTNPGPGELEMYPDELARELVCGLPLDEYAAVAIADQAHPGHLAMLERKIADHLQHVTDAASRARLEAARADLQRAIGMAATK